MIDEFEARRRVLEATPRGAGERVPLASARGCFAAEAVIGRVDLPGFDNSAMDGYAVKAAQAAAGACLKVSGEQSAGRDMALQLGDGEAIRIFTGAPVPTGADAVVMQEDVERNGDEIVVRETVAPGEFVRRRGADVCVGQKLMAVGDRIGAARVALLASQGIAAVDVFSRPRVVVVTTGDELRDAGENVSLRAGEIFNSNAAMLAALVERFGAQMVGLRHATDEVEVLRGELQGALETADVVIVAGGVSVGERDLVKEELAALGAESGFWKVKVKPGKPFLFGRRGSDQLVFGLPGNPVSAFTTFLLFVAPALEKWRGGDRGHDRDLPLMPMTAVAGRVIKNPGDRPHYVRGQLDAGGRFSPVGMQQSHAIFGMSRASAMLRVDAGTQVEAGETVTVWRLDDV